jgi:8-oxo-dGTP pyrophosphatase MutT (NUDIX family)
MRPLIDLAYRLRRRAMALVGWRTRGVKVMAFDLEGRVLLVRHRYGRSDLWMLPGGGIARGETPAEAAVREMMEETSCRLARPEMVGCWQARAEGRRDTVYLLRGTTADTPQPDGIEIAEARFFPPHDLPETVSPATRRRVEEMLGLRLVDGQW